MVGIRDNSRASYEDQRGQALIEFALSMLLFMSFFLFYFQLAMTFAFGSFAQYATFMSARAYLSAGPSVEDQETRARDVIVRMLKKSIGASGVDRFPSIARGVEGEDPPGYQLMRPNPSLVWMTGVRYKFRSKVFVLPLAGSGSSKGAVNSVTLTSESFLGRDPTAQECQRFMGGRAFDNGC
ncbi:MAG: TadE/TadG family type IV pilus assembly protein [Bdellovibrionia bacterium]